MEKFFYNFFKLSKNLIESHEKSRKIRLITPIFMKKDFLKKYIFLAKFWNNLMRICQVNDA